MNIKDAITKDIRESFTFDLPRLRYFGEEFIPVFLWDSLKNYADMQTLVKGFNSNNYRFMHHEAVTTKKFLPWYNIQDGSFLEHVAYCLEEPEDLDFLSCPTYTYDEVLPIKGKVAGFNLQGIQTLDKYYENEFSFERVLIEVSPLTHQGKTGDKMKAYAYLNTLEDIATDDKGGRWSILNSLDFVPFSKTKDNKYYQM